MEPDITISIVIPTHNRAKSLEHLLSCLGRQSYPLHLMEVIVVADGCYDNTGSLLRGFEAPYALKYLEQESHGAAIARNRGAAKATGHLLLFLDDDIEPSKGLVEAHVTAHTTDNNVVVGYLPYHSTKYMGFYIKELKAWWENKFHFMRKKGYRYTCEDLLSGNFSLPATMFGELGGFNENLRCREDYEFGVRLMKANAQFVFSSNAWGKHLDEATDFNRSLKRKQEEGKADVVLGRLHPDLISTLRIHFFKASHRKTERAIIHAVYTFPLISKPVVQVWQQWLKVLEWFRLRDKWHKQVAHLQNYWYLRGVAQELPSLKQLRAYLTQPDSRTEYTVTTTVDLKKGIKAAERMLDIERPHQVVVVLGDHYVGTLVSKPGSECWRGEHLRAAVATQLAKELSQGLAVDSIFNENSVSKSPIVAPVIKRTPLLL
ncbi:glycosyltransferase family 2 protein [Pontibacter sp. CAU 1760]